VLKKFNDLVLHLVIHLLVLHLCRLPQLPPQI
jgi:hypothetical protein